MTVLTRRAEGELRLRRAQLQPDQALLGLGSGLHGLLGRRRARGHPHRQGPEQRRADPVADDRRHLLELPVGGLLDHRRADQLGALGGHARVHHDGAGPARVAALRRDDVRDHLGPHPHRRRADRCWSCSSASTCRRPTSSAAGGDHAHRLAVDHRHRHDGRDAAADLGRARRSDGLRHPTRCCCSSAASTTASRSCRSGCR